MRRRSVLLAITVLAAVLVSACSGSQEEATATVAPAVLDRGEQLYEANCAACHGSDLRGTDRGPSHLSVVYEPSHHADVAFLLAVRNGARAHHWNFGDMPPIQGLSDDDVSDIVAYVRSVQRRDDFEPYPP